MASITVSESWMDPTSTLTTGTVYVVQNKASGPVQFFEGPSFDATTNANDGITIVPLSDGGSGASSIRWTYDSSNQVRMRMVAAPFGGSSANLIEFALAS